MTTIEGSQSLNKDKLILWCIHFAVQSVLATLWYMYFVVLIDCIDYLVIYVFWCSKCIGYLVILLFLYTRSTPCPSVKHGDDWGDPTQCDGGDNCPYCHTRTEQQFHPEVSSPLGQGGGFSWVVPRKKGLSQEMPSLSFEHAVSCKTSFFDRRKFLWRIFNFDIFGIIAIFFPNKLSPRTWLKCKLPFMTQ